MLNIIADDILLILCNYLDNASIINISNVSLSMLRLVEAYSGQVCINKGLLGKPSRNVIMYTKMDKLRVMKSIKPIIENKLTDTIVCQLSVVNQGNSIVSVCQNCISLYSFDFSENISLSLQPRINYFFHHEDWRILCVSEVGEHLVFAILRPISLYSPYLRLSIEVWGMKFSIISLYPFESDIGLVDMITDDSVVYLICNEYLYALDISSNGLITMKKKIKTGHINRCITSNQKHVFVGHDWGILSVFDKNMRRYDTIALDEITSTIRRIAYIYDDIIGLTAAGAVFSLKYNHHPHILPNYEWQNVMIGQHLPTTPPYFLTRIDNDRFVICSYNEVSILNRETLSKINMIKTTNRPQMAGQLRNGLLAMMDKLGNISFLR